MLEAVELPDGRELHYRYDALARRLSKQVFESREAEWPAKEVRWAWDGHTPLTELDSEEGRTTWVFDPETFNPLAKLAQGKVWGVLTDQIGTPTELIAQDGGVAWQGEIDTYGAVRQTSKATRCPFRWPGQMEDEESELFYNKHRTFDSGLGLFCSDDPLGLIGGPCLFVGPVDPLMVADPFGLIVVSVKRKTVSLRMRVQSAPATSDRSGHVIAYIVGLLVLLKRLIPSPSIESGLERLLMMVKQFTTSGETRAASSQESP